MADEFEMRGIVARLRFRAFLGTFGAVVIVVLLVGGILLGSALIASSNHVSDVLDRGDCRAQIESRFFVAVADAFNSPPAPNPARSAAVAELVTAGQQLHNIEKVCP